MIHDEEPIHNGHRKQPPKKPFEPDEWFFKQQGKRWVGVDQEEWTIGPNGLERSGGDQAVKSCEDEMIDMKTWTVVRFPDGSWSYGGPPDSPDYTEAEVWPAYEAMVAKLRPWTIDFHVAQNDGQVHGAGSHDKTGKHCPADDPNGKLDIVKCAGYWLKDADQRGIKHICWDGCMFPNATLENPNTWNTILQTMIAVRDAHGWN